jgi:lipopolysaccharide biosynthesis regulator YciM
MHQNLLERADLPRSQKVIALTELGQDYLKAGILDRAEEVFKKLEHSPQGALARGICSRSTSRRRTGSARSR